MTESRAHDAPIGSIRMRWAFMGICGALSVVLAGSMVSNFLGARQLTDTVIRGQAGILFHLLHRFAPPGPPPPRDAEVQRAFEAGQELGLQYVALVDPHGVFMEIGSSAGPVEFESALPQAQYEQIGDVVRVWSPKGPPPVPFEGKRPRGPERRGRNGGPPRGARYVIEFVPTQAVAMADRAQIDLFIGLGSLVVLWIGAFAFWRLSLRASVAEAELARKRHLATLGEMSAVIAHELRNPLASLKGHAQLLHEQASADPKMERKAGRVVDEAVRLQALTNGLLDFVRSGKVEREPTSVGDLVREATGGTVATVDADLDCAPESWSFDRSRMRQVLVNLLDNAHHAAPETPAELTVYVDHDVLVFEVHDWGPGVPEQQREEVFAPFHTGRTQGTGLGLAVCRRIVAEHGGTIVCDAHPDGGALFTVRIP